MKKWNWLVSVLMLLACIYSFNYFYSIEQSQKIDEITSHQKIHAKLASKSFHELFEKWNNVLFYLSNDNNVILFNNEGRFELDQLANALKNEIKGITRTDQSGKIIFTSPDHPGTVGTDISKQKHMVKIMTDYQPVVSDVFDAVQGYKAIVIHYPIFKKGKYDGSIGLILNFEQITSSILDEIKIGTSGYAWMLSSDGIEIYGPIKKQVGKSIFETAKDIPSLLNLVHLMLAGKEGISTYISPADNNQQLLENKLTYYLPISIGNTFWSLAISCSEKEITASLLNFRNKLIVIFTFIFLVGIYFSYFGLKAQIILKETGKRHKIENLLARERYLLRTLIDNLPSGVFIKDIDYRKIIANPIHLNSIRGHLKKLGLKADIDILGKTDFEVFPEVLAKKYLMDDEKVILQGEVIINQIEMGIDPEGNDIWLLVSKVPIREKNGNIIGMVGITTDITERKKIEDELTIAKEKAEESDQLKTAFLNNISHEIRTPLNAILGFTRLLNEPNLPEDKRENYIDIVTKSSNQLLLIITDIINIATIEAGQVKVNFNEVDINSVILLLYEQHKPKALSKNIQLLYNSTLSGNDAIIITDQTKFTEILSNLINNAVKFTEQGHVTYGYHLKDDQLHFYVEDTGIGINPIYHKTIFDRFQQANSSLSQKYGGTGLGLSISKAYAEVLGGELWFTSKPDFGSIFYFTIPYKKI